MTEEKLELVRRLLAQQLELLERWRLSIEVALGMLKAGEEERSRIRGAVARIWRETYGICEGCKKAISPDLMQPRPWRTTCAACDRLRLTSLSE